MNFYNALLSIAVPRIRDFRGFSPKSFDGRGNYSLGIKEQIVFPEIEYDKIDMITRYGYYHYNHCKNRQRSPRLIKSIWFSI